MFLREQNLHLRTADKNTIDPMSACELVSLSQRYFTLAANVGSPPCLRGHYSLQCNLQRVEIHQRPWLGLPDRRFGWLEMCDHWEAFGESARFVEEVWVVVLAGDKNVMEVGICKGVGDGSEDGFSFCAATACGIGVETYHRVWLVASDPLAQSCNGVFWAFPCF